MITAFALAAATISDDRAEAIYRRILDPQAGSIVVAHRGCHAAVPGQSLASAPENSASALDHCVAIGVDVMETDVRQSRDGALVMIHDATLDRTTDGKGPVATLTLAQLKALHLRDDLGGPQAPVTDQHVLTLAEMLEQAKGRIVLNLDVKEAIYPEVIDAVVRAGAAHRVIVKTTAGAVTAPLAEMPPYDRIPFMPIVKFATDERELISVMRQQMSAAPKPVGFELPRLSPAVLPALATIARTAGVRLWVNTLWEGFVAGIGGDADAERDPQRVWGRLAHEGVTMIQTDNPAALVLFNSKQ